MTVKSRKRRRLGRRLGLAIGLLLLGVITALAIPSTRHRLIALGRQLAMQLRAGVRRYQRDRLYRASLSKMVYRAAETLPIYTGRLQNGWDDWSWATHRLSDSPDHALVFTPENSRGVYLHHAPFSAVGYGALQFRVHGDTPVRALLVDDAGEMNRPPAPIDRYATSIGDGWRQVRIPLDELGISELDASDGRISGVVFLPGNEADPAKSVRVDDIALTPSTTLPDEPLLIDATVTIDPGADRHPISPYIYGMAFAPPEYVKDLRLTVNRWGGNDKTRYNWRHGNASNAARDWLFANKPAAGYKIANGESAANLFIDANRAAGCATLLTVPTIGWVAKDNDNNTRSQNVPAPGAITGYDPSVNQARTSVRSYPSRAAAPNAPTDAVFQDEWVTYLAGRYGPASGGGVRFYSMDNEPDLWDATHTDIHPQPADYDELWGQFTGYASAIKTVDESALVTGPVSWGWSGYFFSPKDRGSDAYRTHSDRRAHGGTPFLLWFLQQARAADTKSGRRTLDVLDIHYYPQSAGLFTGETYADAPARRLRAVRSLWDDSYVDESWIGEPVRLIGRMKEWIASGYRGTKLGITEWNFGADTHISGGLATAEALGVFGREGVYLANYWAFPTKDKPSYLAFKLFGNADGAGHGFGDISVRARSSAPDRISCYSAQDSRDHAWTIVVINQAQKSTARVRLIGLPETAAVHDGVYWRLSDASSGRLTRGAVKGSQLSLPPQSVTLIRFAGDR